MCQISIRRFLLMRYWNQYREEKTVGSVHLYCGTHGLISDIKQYNFVVINRRIGPFRCLFSSHMTPTCCTWLTHSVYRRPYSVLASLSSQNQVTVKYPAFVFCDSVGSKGQFETARWPSVWFLKAADKQTCLHSAFLTDELHCVSLRCFLPFQSSWTTQAAVLTYSPG